MQQQPQQPPTLNSGASFSPNEITTEQIQKCLDDNKNLIMAILENQNLGKIQECAQYQALLQKNLMYLAAIADAQPPAPQTSTPSQVMQMPPNSMPKQANAYMQQQPGTPQQGGGGGGVIPKLPFQLNALRNQDQQHQLLQFQQQQQQQLQFQAQMGVMRPGVQNGMHQAMQSAATAHLMDARGSKQNPSEAASGEAKSRG